MRNLVNFHTTTQKSEHFTSISYSCPKYMRFELKKIDRSYLSWHWTVMENFKNPDLVVSMKNDITNMVNFHTSSWKFQNLHLDWIHLSKAYKYLDKKSTEELCLMTLTSNVKFEEKLTLGSRNDMKNLVNFNASSGKSGNLHFDVLLLAIAYKDLA